MPRPNGSKNVKATRHDREFIMRLLRKEAEQGNAIAGAMFLHLSDKADREVPSPGGELPTGPETENAEAKKRNDKLVW